jgi:hypothetical protein
VNSAVQKQKFHLSQTNDESFSIIVRDFSSFCCHRNNDISVVYCSMGNKMSFGERFVEVLEKRQVNR